MTAEKPSKMEARFKDTHIRTRTYLPTTHMPSIYERALVYACMRAHMQAREHMLAASSMAAVAFQKAT